MTFKEDIRLSFRSAPAELFARRRLTLLIPPVFGEIWQRSDSTVGITDQWNLIARLLSLQTAEAAPKPEHVKGFNVTHQSR